MIIEEFDPKIHNTLKVAELMFNVDLRVYRRFFKTKKQAIDALNVKIQKLYDSCDDYKIYLAIDKVNCKIMAMVQFSKGRNSNLLYDSAILFKNLNLKPAFYFSLVEFIDNKTLAICNNDDLYLAEIAVAEGYRGQGLATKLINMLINKAKNEGYQRVILDVDFKNPKALKLYQKIGFKIYNKRSLTILNHNKTMYNMEYNVQ